MSSPGHRGGPGEGGLGLVQRDSQVYYSGLIPKGSWSILGTCSAGTWPVTEGILTTDAGQGSRW